MLLTRKTQGQRRNTLQQGYKLEKSPSMIVMMIVVPFINSMALNSMALSPSEIITRVKQKNYESVITIAVLTKQSVLF